MPLTAVVADVTTAPATTAVMATAASATMITSIAGFVVAVVC